MRHLFFLSLLLTSSLANATTLGIDLSAGGSSTSFDDRDYTLGWKFTLNEDATLTALGTWDQDSNGLNVAQKVGLWRTTGELVASTTIDNSATAFASANTAGQWVFSDIADLFLSAGDYLIGADRLQAMRCR